MEPEKSDDETVVLEIAEVELTDGTRLPVSRSCRREALLAMARAELEK